MSDAPAPAPASAPTSAPVPVLASSLAAGTGAPALPTVDYTTSAAPFSQLAASVPSEPASIPTRPVQMAITAAVGAAASGDALLPVAIQACAVVLIRDILAEAKKVRALHGGGEYAAPLKPEHVAEAVRRLRVKGRQFPFDNPNFSSF